MREITRKKGYVGRGCWIHKQLYLVALTCLIHFICWQLLGQSVAHMCHLLAFCRRRIIPSNQVFSQYQSSHVTTNCSMLMYDDVDPGLYPVPGLPPLLLDIFFRWRYNTDAARAVTRWQRLSRHPLSSVEVTYRGDKHSKGNVIFVMEVISIIWPVLLGHALSVHLVILEIGRASDLIPRHCIGFSFSSLSVAIWLSRHQTTMHIGTSGHRHIGASMHRPSTVPTLNTGRGGLGKDVKKWE